MGARLTEIFISDVEIGDTIHSREGALTVESWILEEGLDKGDGPSQWWILFGRDHRNKFRRLRFEGSETVWCLRETDA